MRNLCLAGIIALLAGACTSTDQRISGAAAGAGAGALIGGPIGAIAGGAIGAVAGPPVANTISR